MRAPAPYHGEQISGARAKSWTQNPRLPSTITGCCVAGGRGFRSGCGRPRWSGTLRGCDSSRAAILAERSVPATLQVTSAMGASARRPHRLSTMERRYGSCVSRSALHVDESITRTLVRATSRPTYIRSMASWRHSCVSRRRLRSPCMLVGVAMAPSMCHVFYGSRAGRNAETTPLARLPAASVAERVRPEASLRGPQGAPMTRDAHGDADDAVRATHHGPTREIRDAASDGASTPE